KDAFSLISRVFLQPIWEQDEPLWMDLDRQALDQKKKLWVSNFTSTYQHEELLFKQVQLPTSWRTGPVTSIEQMIENIRSRSASPIHFQPMLAGLDWRPALLHRVSMMLESKPTQQQRDLYNRLRSEISSKIISREIERNTK